MGKTGYRENGRGWLKIGLFPLMAAGALALAACDDQAAETGIDDGLSGGDPCGAAEYADLVGQTRADAEAANLPDPHRIYGPDDMVTMDYREDRLNVVLGADGLVEEVRCG